MGAVVLLVLGVVALFVRPPRVPVWGLPALFAVAGLVTGLVVWADVADSMELLRNPLLFLVFAVPLAVLLDGLGVFAALAAAVDGGRHLVAWLWLLAAVVTVVFNLDAAVVLLTPLYVRIARRHGLPAEMLAFQPALLACLASSMLPVSNLTNLIVAERFDLGVGDFLRHLALPTVAACAVGWLMFRLTFHVHARADGVDEPVDARALRRGLPVIAFVLVGFTLGDVAGVPAWVVAALACLWCVLMARNLPVRSVPVGAIVLAAAMTVLVSGALPHLDLAGWFAHGGVAGDARALLFGVVASDAANNLPAVLAGSASVARLDQVWPLLVGVNIGPVLVLTGALSGLLWRDTAASMGVDVSPRRYAAVGVRVGLPALLVASLVVLLAG